MATKLPASTLPKIIQILALELGARPQQVSAAIELLDEGATVPFIARYRKEVTGNLDDTQLRNLDERLVYLRELEERRAAVLDSIAEQGKLTDELRKAIYTTEGEMRRFRQLVVNSVMATDIVDRNLKALRNARWAKAFSDDATVLEGWEVAAGDETEASCTNRKATIVIEHVIQAADVSHTMQHWHVYRKWNERFFEECYKAYVEGRAETDPSIGWYKGELGFYDFYIIPLAKKLKDCGVFGVSSDECLNYAVRNREEWEEKGQSIVSEMIERTRGQYPFVTQRVDI